MSRGPGRVQRNLVATIRLHGKPMTFAEILEFIRKKNPNYPLTNGRERSLRRALHQLVSDGVMICDGYPARYSFHLMLLGMWGEDPPSFLEGIGPGARGGLVLGGN